MISLFCLFLAVVAIAAVAAQRGRATTAVVNCGTLSAGPGSIEQGTTSGSRCFLRAYQQHCRPALYTLSLFGIDTVATDRFRLAAANGRCRVNVTIGFRVVPALPRVHSGVCRTLALKVRHVVAGRCTGEGIPASIVLDP